MTVPATPTSAGPFYGDGSATQFPFTFKVYARSDVLVTVALPSGDATSLVLDTDYTVTLNLNQDTSPGGYVTYPISGSPLPSGGVLALTGNLQYTQPTDLPDGGAYRARNVETMVDRAVMLVKQVKEALGRTFTFPPTEGIIPEFPSIAERANRLLGFDSNGQFVGVLPVSGSAAALSLDLADTSATSKGDALVGVKQPYTGAVAQTQHDKNLQVLSVEDFTGGSTTAKVQAAINAAPNGSRLLFKPGQTYVLTKNTGFLSGVYTNGDQPCLCVYQKQGLVLDGQGATLRVDVHAQGILDVLESSDILIENFTLVGAGNFPGIDGTSGRAEKGIVGAGYYNASAVANGPSRNNSQNTTAFTAGGYGGNFPQFGGGTASTWGAWRGGGYLTNVGSGIFIGKGSTDVTVRRVEASGFNEDGIQIDAPITESYGWTAPGRIYLFDNYLHDNYNAGVEVHRCSDLIVRGNVMENNGHPNASISHSDIDPGYGLATNNGTAPTRLVVTDNICRGNKRKAIDAHSIDTAVITGNLCTDSGYGIMLVNGSLGTIRNMVVSDNIVARISYPVTAQAAGIYIERNAAGAPGFSGNAVVVGNQVYEVGVPPGQTGIFPGTNPAGLGIQLSGTLDGASVTGNLVQNTTYLGFIGLCIGFAGPDAIKGAYTGNVVRGGWANGFNNLASGGSNNSTIGNTVELTSIAPYAGVQTGMKGAADRFFSGNEITVPAGQNMVDTVFMNRELIVYVVMNGSGSTSWTMAPNQAKYLTSVASNTNGLQFNLAPGISSRAITFAQAASAKLVRTAGSVVIDHIYIRTEVGNTPAVGLQSAGSDNPSNNCTGSITFKILI